MGSENRKQKRILILLQKPASSAVGSDGSFLFTAYTRKKVLFAHSTSPLPRVLASRATDHDKTSRVYAPLKLRVLAAKFGGRRWSVSLGLAWDVGAFPISV